MTSNRAGFTLVELLVIVGVGSLLLLGIYGTLSTQQAAYTAQSAQIHRQQSVRAGLDVLISELRSLSTGGGDILTLDDDSISVRVMRRLGIVCGVTYSAPPTLHSLRVGAPIETGDSLFVFADGQQGVGLDDVWIAAMAGTVDTFTTCNGQVAQRIPLPGATSALAADSVRPGALVRSFEWKSYGIGYWGGATYLGEWSPNQPFTPLVGPLDGHGDPALRLDYFDANGNPTALPADVHRIDVLVRTTTPIPVSAGGIQVDSLLATVYSRN